MIVWPNNSTFSDWCRSCVHVIFIIIIHFDFGPAMCACNNIYFHYHRISYGISWHHYHQHRFSCPIWVLICKKIYSSSIVNTFHEVNVPWYHAPNSTVNRSTATTDISWCEISPILLSFSRISYLRILGICQRLTLQTSYLDSCGGKISLSWRLPGLWLIWVIGRFNSIIMRTSLRWMWLLVVMMRWVCERGPSYGSVEWNEIIKPRTHIFSFKLADCWFWEKAREAFQRSKFDAIINWAS